MSNLIINCPHCDRPTPVELGKRVTSKQRCKHCKLFVGESDIVVGGRKPMVRKKVNVGGGQFGGERNLDEEEDRSHGSSQPKRGFRLSHVIVTLLVVGIGLAGVGYVLVKSYKGQKAAHDLDMGRMTQVIEQIQKNDAADFAPSRPTSGLPQVEIINQAQENLNDLIECETPEELFKFVRNPEQVKDRFDSYYRDGRGELPIKEWLTVQGELRIDYDEELKIAIFYASREDGEPWWVVFEETAEGPKLDWESFVRYSEMEVPDFLNAQPKEPKEFRVLAMIDDYFNYKYSDPREFVCVRLFDPTESFMFYGYVKKESDLGRTIRSQVPPKRVTINPLSVPEGRGQLDLDGMNQPRTDIPGLRKPRSLVTIKVKFPDPVQGSNQAEITEFIRRSWYIP
ncbi:MAG: hypothetical protein ACI9R3_004474 [Verrucomicrobiales bacterium]|jgi:hypothetical protein